jgi:PhoPQ-activated pathogenicity-related protein
MTRIVNIALDLYKLEASEYFQYTEDKQELYTSRFGGNKILTICDHNELVENECEKNTFDGKLCFFKAGMRLPNPQIN